MMLALSLGKVYEDLTPVSTRQSEYLTIVRAVMGQGWLYELVEAAVDKYPQATLFKDAHVPIVDGNRDRATVTEPPAQIPFIRSLKTGLLRAFARNAPVERDGVRCYLI